VQSQAQPLASLAAEALSMRDEPTLGQPPSHVHYPVRSERPRRIRVPLGNCRPLVVRSGARVRQSLYGCL